MTYAEYEAKINDILSKPDTALAEIGGVLEELKTDLTALETLTGEAAAKDERIKDLQETNLKLYLSQSEEATEEEADEEEKDDVIDWEDLLKEEE